MTRQRRATGRSKGRYRTTTCLHLEQLEDRTLLSELAWLWPTEVEEIHNYSLESSTTRQDPKPYYHLNAYDIFKSGEGTNDTDLGNLIFAAAAGEILQTDYTDCNNSYPKDPRDYGSFVKIQHGDLQVYYAHLQCESKRSNDTIVIPRYNPGDKVEPGAILGRIGNTGFSDTPHLHFGFPYGESPIHAIHSPEDHEFFKGFIYPVESLSSEALPELTNLQDIHFSVRAGDTITIQGKAFSRQHLVDLSLRSPDGSETWGFSVATNKAGSFRTGFYLPPHLSSGEYTLVAQDKGSLAALAGGSQRLSNSVKVAIEGRAPDPPPAPPVGLLNKITRLVMDRVAPLVIKIWDASRDGMNALWEAVRTGSIKLYNVAGEALETKTAFASGENPTWVYRSAQPGDQFVVAVPDSFLGTARFLSWVQDNEPPAIDPDPPDSIPPPRNFHDAAGQNYDQAKLVALDGINKGDDIGQISPTDDVDFYRFIAQTTGQIEIDVVPQSGLTTFVTLYDGNRNALNTDSSSGDILSHFRISVTAGQTYFVKVESENNTSTGLYELHIRPYDPATAPGGSGTDGPPGPLPGWGSVRGVTVTLTGGNGDSRWTIDDPGQVRWFQIDGVQGPFLEIKARGGDGFVPFVTAFDANGGPKDSDTADNDGEARVCIPVQNGERIIVAVSSHEGMSTGAFDLELRRRDECAYEPPNTIQLTPEGNGYVESRIIAPGAEESHTIPIRRTGWVILEAPARDSTLVPFLRHDYQGGNTDSAADDGRARMAFFAQEGEVVHATVTGDLGTVGMYQLLVRQNVLNIEDDHPDVGNIAVPDRFLGQDGVLTIHGRIDGPTDNDAFRVRATGNVAVEVIGLTPGLHPNLSTSWHNGSDSDAGSGRGGRTHDTVDNLSADENWVNIDITGGGSYPVGEYILHVWQPQMPADLDPGTVGIEASPILLDGTGNGTLPGSPNGSTPAVINFVGDKDVFQVRAASARPITFTIDGTGSGLPTFLRVYDASGRAVATDAGSGPGATSQITLEAERGQLFYLEVTAFDSQATGFYVIDVRQATDDHPDVAVIDPQKDQQGDATVIVLDGTGAGQASGQIGDRQVPGLSPVVFFNGHAYAVVTTGTTWAAAEATAQTLGGHLVAINDGVEAEFIGTLIRQTLGGDKLTWSGLSDQGTEGAFTWSSGEPVTYANWLSGEPNNLNDEDYVLLNWDIRYPARWNDVPDMAEVNDNEPIYAALELPALVGDRDVFQVTAAQRGTLTVTVRTTDSQLDAFVRVLDRFGNLLALDDDSGDGRNSAVPFPAGIFETYFIEVSGYGDRSVGSYVVEVRSDPPPVKSFLGVYDAFEDGVLDGQKWTTQVAGTGSVQETGGVVRLLAHGTGAPNDANTAVLASTGIVQGDVAFDLTPRLGVDQNSATWEVTDGTASIRLVFQRGPSGQLLLTVESTGYPFLDNAGPQAVSEGVPSHFAIAQTSNGVIVSRDGIMLARFTGDLKPNSLLRGRATSASSHPPPYDDFNDNAIDPNRWNVSGDVVEQNGRLTLWMNRNGSGRGAMGSTQGQPGGQDIRGFRVASDRTSGTVLPGQAECEIDLTNGTDALIIKWLNDVNQFVLRARGAYGSGDQFRWDPGSAGPDDTLNGFLEIREHGNAIEVVQNNVVVFTFPNMSIRPGSYLQITAEGVNEINRDYALSFDEVILYRERYVERFAQLDVDNVQGNMGLRVSDVVLYEDFQAGVVGQRPDPARWNTYGDVRIASAGGTDLRLNLAMFRDGQKRQSYASTAGKVGGTGIRGIRVATNRTEGTVGSGDAEAWIAITNGHDAIGSGLDILDR